MECIRKIKFGIPKEEWLLIYYKVIYLILLVLDVFYQYLRVRYILAFLRIMVILVLYENDDINWSNKKNKNIKPMLFNFGKIRSSIFPVFCK